MTPDAPAADNAPLTIDQAIASLGATEKKDEAPAQAAQPEQIEADPAAEDASEPETAIDGEPAETEVGETEGEQPEQSAIEPPRFWDAEAKKRFGELPPDLQQLVLAKETERDKATARAIEDAALKRKAAEGEASRIAQLNGVMDKLLPQAIETFKSRWENVDWNAVVDQYGAEQALKLRNDYDRERGQIQQLHAVKSHADQVQYSRFVQSEMAKLPAEAPELADPKLGEKRRSDLGNYLIQEMTKRGLDTGVISRMSAFESSLAYDAMRWRQAQAKARDQSSAPPTPARQNTQPRPSVRPTASPARAPETARLKSLEGRFHQDPSIENLEALLNA